MRIDSLNSASRIYEVTASASVKPKKTADQVSDSYEISQTAKNYQIAKAAVKNASDVREDKVAKLKEQISNGTYSVSAEAVAEKILGNMNTLTF